MTFNLSCGQKKETTELKVEEKKETVGFSPVKVGGNWGYIDKTGKIIINLQFDGAWSFSEGLALVEIGKRQGYIDKTGKFIINPQFSGPGNFLKGWLVFALGLVKTLLYR